MNHYFSSIVRHLLYCNAEQILKRSLLHCHAHNVHSIMLLECPGKTIRLFVAEPGHKLGGNCPSRFQTEQSVGFHAHYCELTLIPTRGVLWNWIVSPVSPVCSEMPFEVGKFEYKSAITDGKIGFKHVGSEMLQTVAFKGLTPGGSQYMPARIMHSVSVWDGDWCAWLVLEGRENPNHDSHTYSTGRLDQQDFSTFYKPMTANELTRLIDEARIL